MVAVLSPNKKFLSSVFIYAEVGQEQPWSSFPKWIWRERVSYCSISVCSSRMWLYKSLPSSVFCGDKQGVLQTERRHYWSWLILQLARVQEENLFIVLWHVRFLVIWVCSKRSYISPFCSVMFPLRTSAGTGTRGRANRHSLKTQITFIWFWWTHRWTGLLCPCLSLIQ